jgi:hypothetical protein
MGGIIGSVNLIDSKVSFKVDKGAFNSFNSLLLMVSDRK